MFVRLNGKEVVVMPFDSATIYALVNGLVETLEYGVACGYNLVASCS